MGILEWMVQSLRERGLHDEADAHEAVHAGEVTGAALAAPAASPASHDDAQMGGGQGGQGGRGGGMHATAGAEAGDSGSHAQGPESGPGEHGGGIGGDHGGGQDAAVSHDGPDSPTAVHGRWGVEPGAPHEPHSPEPLDPQDPLAGLHSGRLRESLSREAFRSASTEAQDAAIAERVLPPNFKAFMESAEHASFPAPQPLVEWRASRAAAIAALGDALPNFARGAPSLDPLLMRAADAGPVSARDAEPARASAPTASAARGLNQDFER